MWAGQSPDQLIAGAWPGGQGAALSKVPRHRPWPTLYGHGHSSAHPTVPGRTDSTDATVRASPDPSICALTLTPALKLRAAHPPNICAASENLNTVSFYDPNGNAAGPNDVDDGGVYVFK